MPPYASGICCTCLSEQDEQATPRKKVDDGDPEVHHLSFVKISGDSGAIPIPESKYRVGVGR
jgi:hypothetical protein